MSLTHKLKDGVLETREESYSYIGTKVNYWYYDIKDWRVSSNGRKGDTPDRPMTVESIAWVRKHYLPKVGIPFKG